MKPSRSDGNSQTTYVPLCSWFISCALFCYETRLFSIFIVLYSKVSLESPDPRFILVDNSTQLSDVTYSFYWRWFATMS